METRGAALSGVGNSAVVAAAVKILRRMYPSVGNPTASAVHYWNEQTPFVGGAKTYVPVDGDSRHFAELAQPLSNSRLLFAGEATCAKSYGARTLVLEPFLVTAWHLAPCALLPFALRACRPRPLTCVCV